ncbi:MAG: aminotransferase class I/II-fold pyridoxal phosphate-dependent enzyme [Prevotella sp.]|jgi:threonine-phosphate decarboxylase|nr:aminotransferase class I/II-fold pyridoxal phosphate-dependent enzyme [Prevotella sp.]
MINGHGDDIYGKVIVSNFSSNIYNGSDTSALDAYLCERIPLIHSYPEPDAASLASLISEKNNIPSGNVCITNGATEAIYLIAQAFGRKKSAIITPTFSEYEDACKINGHSLFFFASLSQIREDTELVWLCNPNNPDGNVYHKQYLERFITEHPDIYFIIDQSYEAFTDKQYTFTAQEGTMYRNVIILHSMTKTYAIPGIRLGYMTGNDRLIDKVNAFRMPWSVNQLAIEAGKYLLLQGTIPFDLETCLAETRRFMIKMNGIEGLVVLPTNTHFFLCELYKKKASDLKQYLIDNHGILIRDAANFRGLDKHYFRVATQSPEENDNLVKAIKAWI